MVDRRFQVIIFAFSFIIAGKVASSLLWFAKVVKLILLRLALELSELVLLVVKDTMLLR